MLRSFLKSLVNMTRRRVGHPAGLTRQALKLGSESPAKNRRSPLHVVSAMIGSRLPNARMLNIWLNIKNNSSWKKIENLGISCNRLIIKSMHSYVCGINLRSESSLFLSDLHFA